MRYEYLNIRAKKIAQQEIQRWYKLTYDKIALPHSQLNIENYGNRLEVEDTSSKITKNDNVAYRLTIEKDDTTLCVATLQNTTIKDIDILRHFEDFIKIVQNQEFATTERECIKIANKYGMEFTNLGYIQKITDKKENAEMLKNTVASEIMGLLREGNLEGLKADNFVTETYDTGLYIIGTYEAKRFLSENINEMFDALEDYELEVGQPFPHASDAEKLGNLVIMYVANYVWKELATVQKAIFNDEYLTEETVAEILTELKEKYGNEN